MPRRFAAFVAVTLLTSCADKPAPHALDDGGAPIARDTSLPASARPASTVAPIATEPGPDPDGDDDPSDTGSGPFPERARFEKVGKPKLALRRICDLTPFDGALYAAHAIIPLDMDGATISRYDPRAKEPFSVAFDWNRPGEPAKNGGAGQGFLRVHAIGGRLFVPDADPPYNGFEITEPGTEGYVFVSDTAGNFAPARMPHHQLPAPPSDSQPGAGILPRAYHVLDVIRFRGRLHASTGSVPPGQRAWHGPAPGALHVAGEDMSRWTYEVDYPNPWRDGVSRLTYMIRFKGRLYAGIQDFEGTDPTDYVVFDTPHGNKTISQHDVKPVRVTDHGGHHTIRWYADGGKLYWIAQGREGTKLRVTEDGDTWRAITFPKNAGAPTDVTRFRGVIVALTERGLWRLDGDTPASVATVTSMDGRSPFEHLDLFCAAPLGVLDNELYAGSQRDGSLWKLSEMR
ncbi:hypothetical protein A7982_12510 [Minicystis rosea]|nr:hypothetical protein A7982_12510 [Minicystis rosea]